MQLSYEKFSLTNLRRKNYKCSWIFSSKAWCLKQYYKIILSKRSQKFILLTHIASEISSFNSFKTGWTSFPAWEVPSFFRFENPPNLMRKAQQVMKLTKSLINTSYKYYTLILLIKKKYYTLISNYKLQFGTNDFIN